MPDQNPVSENEPEELIEPEDVKQKKSFLKSFWWLWLILAVLVILVLGSNSRANQNRDEGQPSGDKSKQSTDSSQSTKPNDANESPKIATKAADFSTDNPPKFIQADFVELDKVFMISKFRSGLGHDFSYDSGETCRSMKHYFDSIDSNQPDYKVLGGGDKANYPLPDITKDVKIFSPVDGTLKFVNDPQVAFNHELQVTLDAYPSVVVRLMHVQNAPGISEGHVKAGQLIGLVLANQSFDLAIQTDLSGPNKIGYISYFAAMPDDIFAKYQARGVTTRDEMIITKEFRDAHPFGCHDKEVFDQNYAADNPAENVVYLSGYKEVPKDSGPVDKNK